MRSTPLTVISATEPYTLQEELRGEGEPWSHGVKPLLNPARSSLLCVLAGRSRGLSCALPLGLRQMDDRTPGDMYICLGQCAVDVLVDGGGATVIECNSFSLYIPTHSSLFAGPRIGATPPPAAPSAPAAIAHRTRDSRACFFVCESGVYCNTFYHMNLNLQILRIQTPNS